MTNQMSSSMPMTCAVVDSHEYFRVMVSDFLSDLGFLVSQFDNGAAFIHDYEDMKYDLVFIDSSEDTGFVSAVVERVCRDDSTKIIVMCNVGDTFVLDFEKPPSGFIFKPLNSGKVLAKIWEVMLEDSV